MADLDGIPALDRPPTYATTDPGQDETGLQSHSNSASNKIATQSPPSFELHRDGSHYNVLQDGNTLYHVSHYEILSHPNLIIYAGYDAKGPQLALVEFIPGGQDFKIYVGGLKQPTGDDWDIIRCANPGVWPNTPEFRFETKQAVAEGSPKRKLKYHWTKMSKWSYSDFKLIDEIDDYVVAEYVESGLGVRTLRGKVVFSAKLDEMAEMICLVVLFGLLEKIRQKGVRYVTAQASILRH